MESSSGGGDDQASGWMQVKKKHRSNLKFSLHGWVEGLSGKQRSSKSSKSNNPQKSKCGVNETQTVNVSEDCGVHLVGNAADPTSIEDEAADHCLDKCGVSQTDEDIDSSLSATTKSVDTKHEVVINQENTQKDNHVLPKIKWGDLDEGTLIHFGKAPAGGFKFGDIKTQNMGSMKDDVCEDQIRPKSKLSSPRSTSVEETTKEVNEVSLEDVREQITSEDIVSQSTNNVSGFDVEHKNLKLENGLSGESSACKDNEETYMIKTANILNESDCSNTLPMENSEPETSGESKLTALIEESSVLEIEANVDGLVDRENTNEINSDATGESKERFRERLWCFLFENLNRAIDELYLLCELECDLEQMKEASLVLEEAALDFRELKSRVEKFEKLKRSLSRGADGASLVMQSDHRRPHALSWEVRRMTTSPRRAEILSSSLEAFRKIQQERTIERANTTENMGSDSHIRTSDILDYAKKDDLVSDSIDSIVKAAKHTRVPDAHRSTKEKRIVESGKSSSMSSRLPQKEGLATYVNGKSSSETHRSAWEGEKLLQKKNKVSAENSAERNVKPTDPLRRNIPFPERERRNSSRSMDAWKDKRNWEDILASPHRVSSRFSYSPGMNRKSAERVRVLHDKLMSPEKKKKSSLDLKKEAEEKHARATRIRTQLEHERVQKLQRTSEKLNRVNEWQTVRSNKLRESMFARHQRSESRHEAHLAQVVRRAGDESSKVNEVRFITSLNEENKKHILRKKLQDSELRRAEKLQVIKIKQKEDMAREEAVLERKRLIEAEKLQRLAETQRRKEEAQVRREEERKASSAAREAKAIEQMRRKEIRAKARQEEAELLAQKLAERLSESEQRRKFYLEQIREKASMDFTRDQSSPLLRRVAKTSSGNGDDNLANDSSCVSGSGILNSDALQHSLKRKIKKIRQRLMSLKHEFPEPLAGLESTSLGYRTAVGTARGKIGRWVQDLQKLRQARKDGAANFGLITAEMVKFLEGKDAELQASRQAGLLDFIASALPASHTSKPEACQVTIYLLRLLRIVLATPANKCYCLVQNLLPPIIPMLAAALENYIKMAASLNIPGPTSFISSKNSAGNFESISEIVDGFLWIVAAIIGHVSGSEQQLHMQVGLIELVIAYQIIHRLRDLFALYDRPQVEGSPFPSSILLGIDLLTVMTSKFRESSSIDWDSFPTDVEHIDSKIQTVDVMDESLIASTVDKQQDFVTQKDRINSLSDNAEQNGGIGSDSKQPASFLLSAMLETGLVCLPSMLTAVLLQANNRLSAEQSSFVLPSNFEEVATGVLKVLNNVALIDITFIQKMLARPDLKMEFFHLMSFILSHCTSNWGLVTDKIGMLLMESLSLLGYFALFHPENQAVLRWGKTPTILHKICDLPFVFFSDPELMPVLAGTLVAASYGCEQNKAVIQQELSLDILLPSLKSCKTTVNNNGPFAEDSSETIQQVGPERKSQSDSVKSSNRNYTKIRLPQKGSLSTGNIRSLKARSQRDGKVVKVSDETNLGSAQSASETCSTLMLHCRFPVSFIERAEQFFAT